MPIWEKGAAGYGEMVGAKRENYLLWLPTKIYVWEDKRVNEIVVKK